MILQRQSNAFRSGTLLEELYDTDNLLRCWECGEMEFCGGIKSFEKVLRGS